MSETPDEEVDYGVADTVENPHVVSDYEWSTQDDGSVHQMIESEPIKEKHRSRNKSQYKKEITLQWAKTSYIARKDELEISELAM